MFRPNTFEPWVIVEQIVLLQAGYYVAHALLVVIFWLLFSIPLELSSVISARYFNFSIPKGWAIMLCFTLASFFISFMLSRYVVRAKRCLDHVLTLYMIHFLIVFFYDNFIFPSWAFWLCTFVSISAATILAEHLCLKVELRAIDVGFSTASTKPQKPTKSQLPKEQRSLLPTVNPNTVDSSPIQSTGPDLREDYQDIEEGKSSQGFGLHLPSLIGNDQDKKPSSSKNSSHAASLSTSPSTQMSAMFDNSFNAQATHGEVQPFSAYTDFPVKDQSRVSSTINPTTSKHYPAPVPTNYGNAISLPQNNSDASVSVSSLPLLQTPTKQRLPPGSFAGGLSLPTLPALPSYLNQPRSTLNANYTQNQNQHQHHQQQGQVKNLPILTSYQPQTQSHDQGQHALPSLDTARTVSAMHSARAKPVRSQAQGGSVTGIPFQLSQLPELPPLGQPTVTQPGLSSLAGEMRGNHNNFNDTMSSSTSTMNRSFHM